MFPNNGFSFYEIDPRLQLERIPTSVGLVFGTAKSASQRLTFWVIGTFIILMLQLIKNLLIVILLWFLKCCPDTTVADA